MRLDLHHGKGSDRGPVFVSLFLYSAIGEICFRGIFEIVQRINDSLTEYKQNVIKGDVRYACLPEGKMKNAEQASER